MSTDALQSAQQGVVELRELFGEEPTLTRLIDTEPDLAVIREFAAQRLREGRVESPEHALRLAEIVMRLDATIRAETTRRLSMHSGQFASLQQVVYALDVGSERISDVVTRELCTNLGYAKAMFSVVRGSKWAPIALAVNPALGGDFHDLITAIDGREISLHDAPREAELVRRRQSYTVEGVDTYRHTYRPLLDLSRPAGYLAVPVVVDARAVAMIHVDRQSDALSETDLHLVGALAAACASAKERAELRRQICGRNAQLEAEMHRLTLALREVETSPVGMPELAPHESTREIADPHGTQSPHGPDSRPSLAPRTQTLTTREREVLDLVATGATNATISRRLYISDGTVKSHVQRIFKKLGVSTRAEVAAMYANLKTGNNG